MSSEIEGVSGSSDAELATTLKDQIGEVTPKRPDVTPVGYTVILAAVLQLTTAFGIWSPDDAQREALNVACATLASLGIGDAILRFGRNRIR